MTARMMLIAAATLGLSALAGAAAPNGARADPSRAPSRPADMVLASAETVPVPDQAQPQAQPPAAPAKRVRVARVTTCRCGDPAAPATGE